MLENILSLKVQGGYFVNETDDFPLFQNTINILYGRNVSIRRMPYCVPRKCFVPLHHDFNFFKLWYKARNN